MEKKIPLEGFPGYYVTDAGKIYHGAKPRKPGIPGNCEYPMVAIKISGMKPRAVFVHLAVINAFKGPKPFETAVCMHLDGNIWNMNSDNLEWGTRGQNNRMTVEQGRRPKVHCEQFDAATIREIRSLAPTMSRAALARKFGRTRRTMNDILQYRYYAWVA